jgi:two-component system, OmpR family, phosphate regulon sensor histidine kinase PhoR
MSGSRVIRIVLAIAISAILGVMASVLGAPVSAVLTVIAAGGFAILLLAEGRTATVDAPADRQATQRRSTDEEAGIVTESQLIGAIGEPVLLVVEGRVRIANAAARALLGTHIEGEDVRLAIRHPAATEMLAGSAGDGDIELIGLGGRDQRVRMRVATLPAGVRLIHLSDRTGSHAAERARVDFVANASHELRTPLAAILGFIETLDDPDSGGDAAVRARFLSVMDKEARRMQRLIDDLISLSRIEAEKFQLPETPVALADLIEDVADELRDGAGGHRADLIVKIAPDVPVVNGDRAQLSQVIHNLASNAFKYGRGGAPVTIALDCAGALIRISVTDQGDGIAPEHLPRLTERFYRVDPGRSRSQGGTGLGLSIVKHIVERHRGRLDIASTPGIGTTVSVLLPVISPTRTKATVTLESQN